MFDSINYKLFGVSILLLIVGYVLLGQGPVTNHLSWSVAPVVLVIVYCFLIPMAIIVRGKSEKKK
jgi:uncharacterized membrane protein